METKSLLRELEGSCHEMKDVWLKKRHRTTYAFLIETFFLGVEYSIFFLTLWDYIKTLLETNEPKLIYSIASSSYLLSAIILSVIIGKIVDKTREVKKVVIICNILLATGNILYSVSISYYFVIFGRMISGCGASLRSVISSEVARCFPPNELTSKFALLGMAFNTGFLVGPALNFAFINVDIQLSFYRITAANAAGLYMGLIFIILTAAMALSVSDLSKEYDLKAINHERKMSLSSRKDLCHKNEKEISSKEIFTKFDILLIMFCSYIFLLMMVNFDMTLPIEILDTLKWSMVELNAIILSSGALSVLCMSYIGTKTFSDKALYYTFLFSISSLVSLQCIILIIKIYGKNKNISIPLWCVWVVLFTIVCVIEDTYLTSAFAKMIPSEIQAFGESLRLGFARCGSLTALIISAYVYDYYDYFTYVCSSILWIFFIVAVIRKTKLMSPTQIT